MLGFVLFLVIHVTMVALTGLSRNMNHIVLGSDDTRSLGLVLGLVAIAVVVLVNAGPTGPRGASRDGFSMRPRRW